MTTTVYLVMLIRHRYVSDAGCIGQVNQTARARYPVCSAFPAAGQQANVARRQT